MLKEGTAIEDRYEIRAGIGSGGMGVVYEAFQPALDRIVALKMLTGMTLDDEEYRRFEREGLILSKLLHKNIVRFYAYGRYQSMPYIVMERLQGQNLQELLFAGVGLPDAQVIDVFQQVCGGLEHAHLQGILHRDIKPSNVVLEPGTAGDTVVKLIDFGLAKLSGEWQVQKLTQTGMAIGSVIYMSPEQCVGQPSGVESDVYSLGCLLFHMLTGDPPFNGEQTVTVMFQHLNQPVQECRGWERLSESVQDIIAKAMQKSPENRYRSVSAMSADVEELRRSGAPLTVSTTMRRKNVAPTNKKIPARFLLVVAVVFAGLLALITATMFSAEKVKPEQAIFHASDLGRLVRVLGPPLRNADFIKELELAVANAETDPTANQDNLICAYTRLADYYVVKQQPQKVKELIEKSFAAYKRPGSRSADEYVMGAVDYYEACSQLDDFDGAERILNMAMEKEASGLVAPGIMARAKILLARLYQQKGDSIRARKLFFDKTDRLSYIEGAQIAAGIALAAEFGSPMHARGAWHAEPLVASGILDDAATNLSYAEALTQLEELTKAHTWNNIRPEELSALKAALRTLNPIKDKDQLVVLSGFDQLQNYYWHHHNLVLASEAARLGLERCPKPYGAAKDRYLDLALWYRSHAVELGNPGRSREYLEAALLRAPRFNSIIVKGPLTPSRLRLVIAEDCLRTDERERAKNLFLESASNLFVLMTPVEIACAFELAHEFGVPPNLQSGRSMYFAGPPRRFKPAKPTKLTTKS